MMNKTSILRQSLGFSTVGESLNLNDQSLSLSVVTGSESTPPPRFLGSLYPRLAVGLLALVTVSLTSPTAPAYAQEPTAEEAQRQLQERIEAENRRRDLIGQVINETRTALDNGDIMTAVGKLKFLAGQGNAEAQNMLNNLSQERLAILQRQMDAAFAKGQREFNRGNNDAALGHLYPLLDLDHPQAQLLVAEIERLQEEQERLAGGQSGDDECGEQGLLGRSEEQHRRCAGDLRSDAEIAAEDAFISGEIRYHSAVRSGRESGTYNFDEAIADLQPLTDPAVGFGYAKPAQDLLNEMEKLLGRSVGGGSLAQMRAEYERWRSLDGRPIDVLRPLAEKGYGPAQAYLGYAYRYGRGGLAENEAKADEWLRKAAQTLPQQAEAGDHYAQRRLAMQYWYGANGFVENKATACSWFRKSAAQGNSWAKSAVNAGWC